MIRVQRVLKRHGLYLIQSAKINPTAVVFIHLCVGLISRKIIFERKASKNFNY